MPRSRKRKQQTDWQSVALEAQAYRDASISRVQPSIPSVPENLPPNVMHFPSKLLTRGDLDITKLPPEVLLSMLASGEITATATITAFLRHAGLAQKLTNCITELLPEPALERARHLDDYFSKHKKPKGPLHGLPISVKEHIGMKGLGLNSGYVASWDKIADEDARVLQILWNAGAVFHARTTQPQSLMHLETDSNLYGITVSPYNRDLSAGGSSGGEGALIGLRGSLLGIGTDIGGSVRSPAANNGIYGFKPTSFRVPTDGWSSTRPGADAIATVIGPLSSSLAGLRLFMQTILAAKPWLAEPALIPMPWNSDIHISPTSSRPLKIGVLWHDNEVKPHPPMTRALQVLVAKLEALAHVKVVDWKPYLHDEAWAIISALYYPDGGKEESSMFEASGEPWRPLTEWIIKENPCVKELTTQELFYWQEEREAYRAEYAEVWNDTATEVDEQSGELKRMVDVVLCPAGPGVAPKHGTAKYWGYTSVWNLLDYPAVVFPVQKVSKKLDKVEQGYKPMNQIDDENWALYDPEVFDGLPVSLQLVGRRFEDEKVLATLDFIKEAVGLPFCDFP